MNSIIHEEARGLASWNTKEDICSIYTAMREVKNARRAQGKRYPLALVLTYILLAKAAGETTLQAISAWIRLRSAWLQVVLPGVRPTFPCVATYSNVLRAVDAEQVNEVLMALFTWVRAEERKKGEQTHVALNGQMLRGTQKHLAEDQQNMHQVNLYETGTGI